MVLVPRIRARNIAEHKAMTHRQLLEAGFKLFATGGYAGTSLTDVASLAGVGRTTVYEYFANKEELFLELIDDRVPPLLEAAMAQLPDAPPDERMEMVFRASFDVLERHVDLAHVLFVVGRELPAAARDRMWRSLDPARDELLRLCRLGIDSGLFPAVDAGLLHQLVADLLVGAVDQVLALGDFRRHATDVLEARIRFLHGGATG